MAQDCLRVFIALWYLLGWMSHVFLVLTAPATYAVFGTSAIAPLKTIWQTLVMPHIVPLALLLALFEIGVGCLIVSKGKWVRYGLILSVAFNLFVVALGLGVTASDPLYDFLVNRLANVIFIALQIPLFWADFKHSVPEGLRNHFARKTA